MELFLLKALRKKLCLLNDPAWGPTLLSVSELIHPTSFAFSYSKRHKWSASDFLLSCAQGVWKGLLSAPDCRKGRSPMETPCSQGIGECIWARG